VSDVDAGARRQDPSREGRDDNTLRGRSHNHRWWWWYLRNSKPARSSRVTMHVQVPDVSATAMVSCVLVVGGQGHNGDDAGEGTDGEQYDKG
jgi:hypothetical protein